MENCICSHVFPVLCRVVIPSLAKERASLSCMLLMHSVVYLASSWCQGLGETCDRFVYSLDFGHFH